jgi:hypothetical protein
MQGQPGVIVKVHPNWTVDVMWEATKREEFGYLYACMCALYIFARMNMHTYIVIMHTYIVDVMWGATKRE